MSIIYQNLLKLEDSHHYQTNDLVEFCEKNRRYGAFIEFEKEDIKRYLNECILYDTIKVSFDKDGKINGILTWEIERYIPLLIRITQCITIQKGVMQRMAGKLLDSLPPNFVCYAMRHGKRVIYKDPRLLFKKFTFVS